MKILLIRHAESANNLQLGLPKEVYQSIRSPDPNITEKGRAQSEKLALHILKKKYNIKRFYCSAMKRSIETAMILKKILNINLEIKVSIHELGGMYQGSNIIKGKTRSQIKTKYPGIFIPPEVTEEGWCHRETKESRSEGLQRAKELVEEFQQWAMQSEGEDEWVALVTHGAFMDLLLAVLLDRKEDSKLKLVHANTGLSAFEFNKDGTNRMLFINSSDHLDDEFVPLPGEASKLENAVDYENDEELEKKILEHPHPLHRSMSAGYSLKKKAEKDRKKKKGHLLETCEEEDYPSPDLKESAETVEKIPAKAVAAYSLEF